MRHIHRGSLGAICLVVAGLFLASTANAQTPVTDAIHISTNKFAWVEQYRQMYADELNQIEQIRNQVQQIQTKVRDIQQQQVNGLKFLGTRGYRDSTLTERSDLEFIEETCGSLGGGLGELLSGSSGPERVSKARERQYAACIELVRAENRRYNVVVKTLNTIRERDEEIARLRADSQAASGEDRGRIARNDNSIAQLEAQHALDVENSHRTLQAYDAHISTLKDEMSRAGQSAFNDKRNSLFGQVVQYGTLKAALQVARRRDR
ncbi:hypothetical protein FQY83_17230 [Luteimonas marina]|uniref:Type IV secretion system protein VirB5 n=1 Tax=Luteimonas marina TaxID=488485 RepID=A0A5C5TVQ2_9GAMM|nr:hypothetical protein [Luteimonas marina]TWT17290.1 hypothetical protein FQY83_17230 [Luteimonas marina]